MAPPPPQRHQPVVHRQAPPPSAPPTHASHPAHPSHAPNPPHPPQPSTNPAHSFHPSQAPHASGIHQPSHPPQAPHLPHPSQSSHPSQPSHSSQPSQPSQPSHASHPSHPSQSPHPSQHFQHPPQQPPQHPPHQQQPAHQPPPTHVQHHTPAPPPQHHQPLQYQQHAPSQELQPMVSLPPPAASPEPVAPAQPPPQPASFSRTTALVPTSVDPRAPQFTSSDPEKSSVRDSTMAEILKHCHILYDFAARYAQLTASLPHSQPSPEECNDMTRRAKEVVRLLEVLRRMGMPEADRIKMDSASVNSAATEDHRPPKRPWEDIQGGPGESSFSEFPAAGDKEQTAAEKDMEIIRTKRATSTAGGNATAGQPKSKYRKRSRATPPGKCHSCNIRETPEWRRGPDGARTLCNACGLHYAKLMRKREKQHGNNPDAPRIDMETLRASARAADIGGEKQSSRPSKQHGNQSNENESSESKHQPGGAQPHQQPHHQGSFQVMQVTTPTDMAVRMQTDHVAAQQSLPTPASATTLPPPPPWATAPSSSRGYPLQDQMQHQQHQSFLRTSDHGSSNHTSPR
ncbi:hypothetical protein PTI98_009883 [Pleurotus ostreatus]|nr:hypothetical protein PTI98_009883 [Pleurotus ostreatus]